MTVFSVLCVSWSKFNIYLLCYSQDYILFKVPI